MESSHRPFRFGVQVGSCPNRESWVDLAKRVEANGFDVLTMPDHFNDQFSPIPALMTVANATTTLRIGTLVLDNDFRHPVVLAKDLSTMDVLSNGRVEIGIGAGWLVSDYADSGITFDHSSVRVKRLEESIAVIKGAMGSTSFSFTGDHYSIDDYNGFPKSIQLPHPPILIAGGGKQILAIAAREANIIGIANTKTPNFGPEIIGQMSAAARRAHLGSGTPMEPINSAAIASLSAEAIDKKISEIRIQAGDRMSQIELNIRAFMINITHDAKTAIENLARNLGVQPRAMAENPFALIGPPSKLIEDLYSRRERWGISYVLVGADDVDTFAPVVAELSGR
ncbi:MAG: TIGR03621 family F420-dependent LLM class oxidoreductase [Acidimicrobiaceae bacterium]|nr:TIGR03621 family F420-dependent LLM class oxidoreductase [Acidimicrobiaceae bacterium]